MDLDPQRALALDPRQALDADRARRGPIRGSSVVLRASVVDRCRRGDGHGPPWATDSSRKAGALALKVRKRRDSVDRRHALAAQLGRQRGGVGGVGRPEAAEASPADGRAQGAAAGPGHRAQAGRPLGHEQADGAAALALLAHRVARDDRPAPGREAVSTSSSWRRSIGQPCSSKSTSTWAEIGVEVSREAMYSGWA